MPVQVLVVDDHPIVRDGLRSALDVFPGVKVVNEARSGNEAVEAAMSSDIDVVIMDLNLPDISGVAATKMIHERRPEIGVLALTVHEDAEYIVEFLRAGGSGFVFKRADIRDVLAAVRAVARGESFLYPSSITSLIVSSLQSDATPTDPSTGALTSREWEVLRLIAEGYSNQEIANTIHRSIKTVQAHRANLMKKLDLHDRGDVVLFAVRKGIITT